VCDGLDYGVTTASANDKGGDPFGRVPLILRSGNADGRNQAGRGFGGALGLTRLLANLLFCVGERDPMTDRRGGGSSHVRSAAGVLHPGAASH
jgi:hypothetical protein